MRSKEYKTDKIGQHGCAHSLLLDLPPLSMIILKAARGGAAKTKKK